MYVLFTFGKEIHRCPKSVIRIIAQCSAHVGVIELLQPLYTILPLHFSCVYTIRKTLPRTPQGDHSGSHWLFLSSSHPGCVNGCFPPRLTFMWEATALAFSCWSSVKVIHSQDTSLAIKKYLSSSRTSLSSLTYTS